MDKEYLLRSLEKSNPWWKGEFEVNYKQRKVYEEIKKFIGNRQILSLTGLRRTGKTTILLKIVKDFIPEFGRDNIFYFSFDDFRDLKIINVIEAYFEFMKKKESEKFLFLFDEIQKINGWEEQLKRIYDENKNFKILISGSESLFIRKNSRESLAGRMFEFKITTLCFEEFLKFREKEFNNLDLYKKEILFEFRKFLSCNGFPEIIDYDEDSVAKYVKENVIERIIYRDIPQILAIDSPEILFKIFYIIAKEPGQIISIDKIACEFNISRQTTSIYLDYLEKSFLIRKLYNFSKNPRKTQTRLKKYYSTIMYPDERGSRETFGRIFESFIVNELNAEFFWRDTYKNEVDIILNEKELIPIEVKTSNIETKPLKLFMKKFNLKKGLILTYDKEGNIDEIDIIPFYKYLLEKTKMK